MPTQTAQQVKRQWGTSDTEVLKALVDSQPIFGEVSINPANLTPNTQAETTVSIAAALAASGIAAAAGDLVFVQPPSTLEAGLVPVSARITATNTLGVTIRNTTAGAIDGAALTWTFMLIRAKRLEVI
jgi:hypothetical protein